eukprot:TRINITY_DN10251_c0_g1_i1.p1 TRINITY_DN10251_c0_g1~~TRINITY_DN10251_c0_g1_i1.p1  ORF type:complete len:314 (-),score=58.63 TRINITY_DN10251_c0_g1_i1:12-896(-)
MSQHLFDLETFFLLGNYQAAINCGSTLKFNSDDDRLYRDFLVYRSHIEQGDYALVMDDIGRDAPLPLVAVKVLAAYMQSEANHERVFTTLSTWIESGDLQKSSLTQLIVAIIYFKAMKYEDVLRVINDSPLLEGRALLVQLYLAINRIDYAQKELKFMQSKKDDAIPTQLASAWIHLHDRSKCEEAAEIYKDLINKYGNSVVLLNGLAVASMCLSQFERAEKILMDALLLDNKSITTRINLVVVSQQLDKTPIDKIKRDINQIVSVAPGHPWVVAINNASLDFDNAQKKFEKNQ